MLFEMRLVFGSDSESEAKSEADSKAKTSQMLVCIEERSAIVTIVLWALKRRKRFGSLFGSLLESLHCVL